MRLKLIEAFDKVPEKCPLDCEIVHFEGKSVHHINARKPEFGFFIEMSPRMEVYEEYLITSLSNLIGIVGGTLGMFVGFSFTSIIFNLFDLIEKLILKCHHF